MYPPTHTHTRVFQVLQASRACNFPGRSTLYSLVGDEYMAWMACGMNGSPWDVISDANCWLAIAAAMAAPNPGGYGECGRPVGPLSAAIGIIVRDAETDTRDKNDGCYVSIVFDYQRVGDDRRLRITCPKGRK